MASVGQQKIHGRVYYEDNDGVEQFFSFETPVRAKSIEPWELDRICRGYRDFAIKTGALNYHIQPPDIKLIVFHFMGGTS